MGRRALAASVLVVLLLAPACAEEDGEDPTAGPDTGAPTSEEPPVSLQPAASAGLTADDFCLSAEQLDEAPEVQAGTLIETSGIAVSRRNDGVVWAHNDSGSQATVHAVGTDGAALGVFTVEGASAVDWEDMAVGSGAGSDLLYLADIGDNLTFRDELTVYRVAEPTVTPADAVGEGGTLTGAEHLTVSYPDGPHDAETLLVDPVTGDLFVVTKQTSDVPTGVYRIPAGRPDGARVEMERVGEVPVAAGELVTGGAVSPDGSVVALRTPEQVLLWTRRPDQTVAEALAATPCQAAVAEEQQGEAIDFTADGRGYVTISEGLNPPIHTFVVE